MTDGHDVRAIHRYLRMSPTKVRLVLDQIRGQSAVEAIQVLKFTNKAAADPISKLLRSAIANAEQNFGLNRDSLYVHQAFANEGPIRRWRRFGARVHFKPIRKRQSHVTLVLRNRGGGETE